MGKYFDKLATKNPWGFCLFGVCRPILNIFFLTHMDTSTLLVRGCNFLPILGTRGLER